MLDMLTIGEKDNTILLYHHPVCVTFEPKHLLPMGSSYLCDIETLDKKDKIIQPGKHFAI
jgi:hypothetical protein